MFRITRTDDAGTPVLRLEGRLTSAEIPLLEESLAGARGAVTLDLAGVRWLDAHAAARLHALRAKGAALTACSPFVERLLEGESR